MMILSKKISFGQRLRRERQLLNWSQEKLAKAIGATSSSINRWEHDKVLPQPYYREQLYRVLGKGIDAVSITDTTNLSHVLESNDTASIPLLIWNVPYLRNIYFTGREDILMLTHVMLKNSNESISSQPCALSGLGGIGKTQIAIEYAYRYGDDYNAILWARADSYSSLVKDFIEIAHLLNLPEKQEADPHCTIAAVKYWFRTHQDWLLILDNVDDLEMVKEFIPPRAKGYILLTTRCQAIDPHIKGIEVGTIGREEGIQFLLRRAGMNIVHQKIDTTTEIAYKCAEKVYGLLDGLPLALDQAAAYVEESQISFQDYLILYSTQHTTLLEKRGSGNAREYPYSVATTWTLSFKCIEQTNSAAADLLRLLAFLHPDTIPEAMIALASAEVGDTLSPVINDPLLFNDIISVLRRFSLIRRSPETKMLTIHRLVQTVLINSMPDELQYTWAERTIRVVNRAFPEEETWPSCQVYLLHAQMCVTLVERWHIESLEAANLFNRVGSYLGQHRQYMEAEKLFQLACSIYEKKLPLAHPDRAKSLYNLGLLYHIQRKHELALPLLEEALNIRQQVLAPDHPDLATSYNCLGWLYSDIGKYKQAELLLQPALANRLKIFGSLHPDVAGSMNDLAVLYARTAKYDKAEIFYQCAISTLEQLPGPPHPRLAITLNNLARTYTDQGRYIEAEPLFHRSLAVAEQVMGLEHPNIGIVFNKLANLYLQQEKHADSETLLLKALSRAEQTWGVDHLYTALSLKYLAELYKKQGNYEQAIQSMRRALTIREQSLGSCHPSVADCLYHLAKIYEQQGRHDEVESYYRRALFIQECTLGLSHSTTITTFKSLRLFLNAMGRGEEEVSLLEVEKSYLI